MRKKFDNLQIQKKRSQTARAKKVDIKNGVLFMLSFFFLPKLWSLNCPKYYVFLQNCADLSKKSKSIKAICLYPSETPHHALSVNSMSYRGLKNSSQNIVE